MYWAEETTRQLPPGMDTDSLSDEERAWVRRYLRTADVALEQDQAFDTRRTFEIDFKLDGNQ